MPEENNVPPVTGDTISLETRVQQLEAELRKTREALHAVNDESAARRIALKQAQEEKDRLEAQRLAEQGQWKELAEKRLAELETLKSYQEKYTAVQQTIQQANERRLATIPEDKRVLVPTGYSPEQLSQWLDASMPLLTAPIAPDLDAGVGRGSKGKPSIQLTPEEIEAARTMGLPLEEYAKFKK
jgi:hypothetical protein